MEHSIFLPTLSHWEYGNEWSGERGLARFLIVPEEGQLNAELWRGPLCRALSQAERSARFPISQEGLEALERWLLEETEALNRENPEKAP
ncbi:MAG: hypothetical protein HFF39_10990 [Lawsonibacter sp.]|nr:hypothetical protein [Lawsonibacter sp.]